MLLVIVQVSEVRLFNIRPKVHHPCLTSLSIAVGRSLGEFSVGVVKSMGGQCPLLDMVGTLHSSGCFASRLNGRQKQANQNSNNRNNYQEFHQREALAPVQQSSFHKTT